MASTDPTQPNYNNTLELHNLAVFTNQSESNKGFHVTPPTQATQTEHTMIRWSKRKEGLLPQAMCAEQYEDEDDEDEDEHDDGFDALSYCSGSVCSKRSSLKPSKWSGGGSQRSLPRSSQIASDERSTKSEVSFDSIGIRQFRMTVGDNPSALGPPVQLDYNTNQTSETFKIDTFEEKRKPRRSMRELRLSTRERHNILRQERRLPQKQINEAVLSAREIRKQRMETHSQSRWEQKYDEAMESAQRKLARYCGWCPVC